MKTFILFTSLAIVISGVLGVNDWRKPCFNGECAYDLPAHSGVSGVFKLLASPHVLTDITPAAGWVILDCDPNTMNQQIRLVCEVDHDESGCSHVFNGTGPANKIVRLPESCGNGPFGRIVNMAVAEDQSLPSHAEGKTSRRDGATPQVHVMSIDSDFSALDHSKSGDVQFAFVGINTPDLDLNEAFVKLDLSDVSGWISSAADTVANAVSVSANWAGDRVKDVGDMIKDKADFSIRPSVERANISVTSNLTLTDGYTKPMCRVRQQARVSATVRSKGWVRAQFGVILAGSILPPKINDMAAYGGLSGEFEAKMSLTFILEGGILFERKLISDMGIPGLSIPGMMTIGPYISVAVKTHGLLELSFVTDFTVSYKLSELQMWYPQKHKTLSKEKEIETKETEYKFQATGNINAKGLIQGAVIPQVHLGLAIGGQAVSASIYLGAEVYMRAIVQGTAAATTNNGNSSSGQASRPTRPQNHKRDLGFNGCFWLDGGVRIKAGAEGNLLGWSAEKEYTIWTVEKEFYKQCGVVGSESLVSKPSWVEDQMLTLTKQRQTCPTMKTFSNVTPSKVAPLKLH